MLIVVGEVDEIYENKLGVFVTCRRYLMTINAVKLTQQN